MPGRCASGGYRTTCAPWLPAGASSLGLFQQRVRYYSAPVTANPVRASNAFLDRLVIVDGWATRPLTEVVAAVQMPRTDLRGAYAKWACRWRLR
jgi:hypothetical protein